MNDMLRARHAMLVPTGNVPTALRPMSGLQVHTGRLSMKPDGIFHPFLILIAIAKQLHAGRPLGIIFQ